LLLIVTIIVVNWLTDRQLLKNWPLLTLTQLMTLLMVIVVGIELTLLMTGNWLTVLLIDVIVIVIVIDIDPIIGDLVIVVEIDWADWQAIVEWLMNWWPIIVDCDPELTSPIYWRLVVDVVIVNW